MPDLWVHPLLQLPKLPACRCVGPRPGVARRWRVPKGWTRAARVAAGVFFVIAIGVAGFNLDCGDRGIPIGIWIQVDHNISFSIGLDDHSDHR